MQIKSFSNFGKRLLFDLQVLIHSALEANKKSEGNGELIIVTCHKISENNPGNLIWKDLYKACSFIASENPDKELQGWRIISESSVEVIPDLGFFRIKESENPIYFYLLTKKDYKEAFSQLSDFLCVYSGLKHYANGSGFFHSAAVYKNNNAYLFFGSSGFGKSTVSRLSIQKGYQLIHDDHVVIFEKGKNNYWVTDRGYTLNQVPIKGMFYLRKHSYDLLVKISPIKATALLFKSALEMLYPLNIKGDILERIFHFSANLARGIPTFELYFRKSPAFWDVIHDEMKNQ